MVHAELSTLYGTGNCTENNVPRSLESTTDLCWNKMGNSQRCFRYFSYFISSNSYNLINISQLRLRNCTENVMADNRHPLCCKLSYFFLSYYQKNLIFPSCRGFFCAGRLLADAICALPLLCSLSMSVMLSRALNIFTASLSQNSRISPRTHFHLFPQDPGSTGFTDPAPKTSLFLTFSTAL